MNNKVIKNKQYFFKIISNIRKDEVGFTLVEMLLSMVIFSFLVFAIIGVYLAFNSSQIRTTASQQLLNDSQFAMEIMTREIRNNVIVKYSSETTTPCSDFIDSGVATDEFTKCIILEKANGQTFAFASYKDAPTSDASLLYILLDCNDDYSSCNNFNMANSVTTILSPGFNGIDLLDLDFIITPNTDPFVSGGVNQQPRVTIRAKMSYISGVEIENVKYDFQTTVSSRIYRR